MDIVEGAVSLSLSLSACQGRTMLLAAIFVHGERHQKMKWQLDKHRTKNSENRQKRRFHFTSLPQKFLITWAN